MVLRVVRFDVKWESWRRKMLKCRYQMEWECWFLLRVWKRCRRVVRWWSSERDEGEMLNCSWEREGFEDGVLLFILMIGFFGICFFLSVYAVHGVEERILFAFSFGFFAPGLVV